jgi:hypothetical protein
MNDRDHNAPKPSEAAFDQRLREQHAEAVAHLSARTRAQLQQRLRASLQAPHPRRPVLAWAMATAAALLLVFGLGRQSGTPAPTVAVAASVADEGADVALDENPDFYLWLASNDATAFASE